MIALLYSILLFGLPLLVIPFIQFPYELPKVIAFEFILYVIALLIGKKYGFGIFQKANKFLLILVGSITILSIFWLVLLHSSTVLFGNVFRMQGIFLLWHLLGFSIVTAVVPKIELTWKLYAITLIGLFVSAFLLIHPETGRAIGTLGESNALAVAAVFLWPFSKMIKSEKSMTKVVVALSFITALAIVFMSQSRAGFIALLVQILFMIILRYVKKPIFSFSLAVGLLGISMLLPLIDTTSVYESRAEIWRTAIHAGSSNPIIGGGFGNISEILNNASWQLSNNIRFQSVDSAHNIFLDWLIQGGIVGLGLFMVLAGYSFYAHIKVKNDHFVLMMLGLLVALSFNPASVVGLVALFWLIGLGYTSAKK